MSEPFHWCWHNVRTTPQRWAALWLRRRGWIVFWLDPQAQECNCVCWLKEYKESLKHDQAVR